MSRRQFCQWLKQLVFHNSQLQRLQFLVNALPLRLDRIVTDRQTHDLSVIFLFNTC
jgi:hypothetical protein